MGKNRFFYQSFRYALSGIWQTIRRERNFRIHLVIASLILLFAYFFGLDRNGWAVLIAAAAAVLAAELFNTAIENACDAATTQYSHTVKLAKDAAAGGVLVIAAAALVAGVFLFGDWNRIVSTVQFILRDMRAFLLTGIVVVIDLFFLLFAGKSGGTT